ncbi:MULTISPECIES: hypothetical protein [Streptosporangium]|uniref:Uncharacterized protein n=1 Tax=Streptosporangium brasiliense TaxID=47480 RepID=A0ABT9RMD9_9ACTN|nr:hypothetical protein [Streptosporangium brasiliense]MDP9870435.1 hypothetical protein [Streptosporangium brasiliense]
MMYINGDSGYYWLTCDTCQDALMEVVAGTALSEMDEAAGEHVCSPH